MPVIDFFVFICMYELQSQCVLFNYVCIMYVFVLTTTSLRSYIYNQQLQDIQGFQVPHLRKHIWDSLDPRNCSRKGVGHVCCFWYPYYEFFFCFAFWMEYKYSCYCTDMTLASYLHLNSSCFSIRPPTSKTTSTRGG